MKDFSFWDEYQDYLFLIWKSEKTRRQFIVGQLSKNGQYEFCYCEEVHKAIEEGFAPLIPFPNIGETYQNDELFSVFASRLPDRKRKDINNILMKYSMDVYDPYEFLKKSGAKLPIDSLQFIDPILDLSSNFQRTFYIAGVRHYLSCEGEHCELVTNVTRGDEVFLVKEPDNIADSNAINVVMSVLRCR